MGGTVRAWIGEESTESLSLKNTGIGTRERRSVSDLTAAHFVHFMNKVDGGISNGI